MGESRSRIVVVPTLVLAWLIPGGGFLAHGRIARGAALFVTLNLTFAIGVLLQGGVVWPAWSPGEAGFNVVNNLTFLFQMGNGLPALVSLAADLRGGEGWLGSLAAAPKAPMFDLSAFYLLVSGSMNYFAVCNTYDRLFGTAAPAEAAARGAETGGRP